MDRATRVGPAHLSMESFFSRFRNPLVLIAIVLVQVIALAVQLPARGSGLDAGADADGHHVTLLRRWIVATVTPVEGALHSTGSHARSAWNDYIYLRNTRTQNQQLEQQIARMREEQAAFAEDAAQGRRLQALLQFKEHYITQTVAAQVIGTSGTDRSRVLYIDKGWQDGLRPEQAVMTPDGVVGKLRDVFPHTAQVLLLSDASSGAGVILMPSRIRGILRGSATGQVEIDNLTSDSRIKPGEKVITSGGDMVYPRGLPVGVVESIAPDLQHQPYTTIKVKPWAGLQQLEEVLVITGTSSTMPPAQQADAAAADAEAQANAADMVAEKLPSLHDDAADGANGATGDAATQAAQTASQPVPKPKPALHPDKYSPGSAPPATDLQPGAKVPESETAPQPPPQ
jgi:rod shape-determining protein MreC